jgi:hypothetical protein
MPVLDLASQLSALDLTGYACNAVVRGGSLASMSTTPGVSIIDQTMSGAGRSCGGCSGDLCCLCDCDPHCHTHED